jgi:hypothetical protein
MHKLEATPFLIIHHKSKYRGFYDVVLDWITLNLPEQRSLFERRALPYRLPENHRFALMIPWLQDPVQQWSRRTCYQALTLTRECDRQKIPVMNRVERLSRAGKFTGAQLMKQVGLRAPGVVRITDQTRFKKDFLDLSFPFFVREDCGHGGLMLRADTPAEARALPLHQFKAPVAIQLIDLRDSRDGFYRKYRYVVAGNFGVAHHLQVSSHWITRGGNRVVNDLTRSEELAYINTPCPHHDAFQRARRALGLDFIAFDYSFGREGEPLVWEANPYPFVHFSVRDLAYRNDAVHRTIAILVASWFQHANQPLPLKLAEFLESSRVISPQMAGARRANSSAQYWQIPLQPRLHGRSRLEQAADSIRDALRQLRSHGRGLIRLGH